MSYQEYNGAYIFQIREQWAPALDRAYQRRVEKGLRAPIGNVNPDNDGFIWTQKGAVFNMERLQILDQIMGELIKATMIDGLVKTTLQDCLEVR